MLYDMQFMSKLGRFLLSHLMFVGAIMAPNLADATSLFPRHKPTVKNTPREGCPPECEPFDLCDDELTPAQREYIGAKETAGFRVFHVNLTRASKVFPPGSVNVFMERAVDDYEAGYHRRESRSVTLAPNGAELLAMSSPFR